MKKIATCILCLLAGTLFTANIGGAAGQSNQAPFVQGFGNCTTLMAQGKAAKGGGLIMAKNRDQSYMTPSAVLVQPHKKYPAGTSCKTLTITLPQAAETYAFTGSGSAGAFGVAFGINEKKVAVASNDANSRDELTYEQGLSDNDVVRLVLERAGSAREGMELVAKLTEAYGQGYHGEIYEIGDPGEIWVIETTGRRWAAKRYTDTVVSRANQFELTDDYDLCSADLVDFAHKLGWDTPTEKKQKFNFRAAYGGEKLNFSKDEPLAERISSPTLYESSIRHQRCEELLHKTLATQGEITAAHMMSFLRDHFSTYRLPSGKLVNLNQIPFYASDYSATEHREAVYKQPSGDTQEVPLYVHSICTHGLRSSTTSCSGIMLAQDQKPSTMLCSLGTPCTGIFVPFFPVQTKVESHYATAALSQTAIATNLLLMGYYEHFAPLVQQQLRPTESQLLQETETLTANATPGQLTAFSQKQAQQAFQLTEKSHQALQLKFEQVFANRHS